MDSDFTKEAKINGMDLPDIPLHKVVYGGLENYGLRLIANGKQVYFTTSRLHRDAAFLHALGAQLKDQDIDAIVGHYASQKGLSFSSSDNKKTAYQTVAREVLDFIKSLGPNENVAALRMRVKELEEKLTDKASTGAVTPKPRRSPISQPATPKTTLPAVVSEDEEEAERLEKEQNTDWLHPYRRGNKTSISPGERSNRKVSGSHRFMD